MPPYRTKNAKIPWSSNKSTPSILRPKRSSRRPLSNRITAVKPLAEPRCHDSYYSPDSIPDAQQRTCSSRPCASSWRSASLKWRFRFLALRLYTFSCSPARAPARIGAKEQLHAVHGGGHAPRRVEPRCQINETSARRRRNRNPQRQPPRQSGHAEQVLSPSETIARFSPVSVTTSESSLSPLAQLLVGKQPLQSAAISLAQRPRRRDSGFG